MAGEKNTVAGEGIPTKEEAAYTPSTAANIPHKTLSSWATWTARETLRRKEAKNLPTCIHVEAVAHA
jgi:hypothetical protein